jgi:hypothetical protein
MKQTAVEWLLKEITDLIPNDIGSQLKFKNKIEQAKELEKQQQGYSEEEVLEILEDYDREFKLDTFAYTNPCSFTVKEWFEQIKKK